MLFEWPWIDRFLHVTQKCQISYHISNQCDQIWRFLKVLGT